MFSPNATHGGTCYGNVLDDFPSKEEKILLRKKLMDTVENSNRVFLLCSIYKDCDVVAVFSSKEKALDWFRNSTCDPDGYLIEEWIVDQGLGGECAVHEIPEARTEGESTANYTERKQELYAKIVEVREGHKKKAFEVARQLKDNTEKETAVKRDADAEKELNKLYPKGLQNSIKEAKERREKEKESDSATILLTKTKLANFVAPYGEIRKYLCSALNLTYKDANSITNRLIEMLIRSSNGWSGDGLVIPRPEWGAFLKSKLHIFDLELVDRLLRRISDIIWEANPDDQAQLEFGSTAG